MVYRFNTQNKIASVRDRLGNTTQYIYNELGNLLKIIDPVGLETTFTYKDGKVTKITDPAHRETLLGYDLAGNLIKITDPDGTSRTWQYDSARHMISETDQRGNFEQTFYDFAGRADSAIRKDGSTLDFNPVQVQGLSQRNLTTNPVTAPSAFQLGAVESVYVDANGKKKTTQLDQAGQLVSSFDEVGMLPSVERNEDNLVTQYRDARGNLTTFTYDEKGNLLIQQDSLSFGGQFIDISQTGTPMSEINGEDDASAFVSLPFVFDFYGRSYTQIAVSSNGLLSFGGTNSRWGNESLDSNPFGLLGLPSILPFWDDLEASSDEGANASIYTQVLGEEGHRQFVIQWQEIEAYYFGDETGEITFQVILTEGTNGLQFNYLDVEFEGNTDVVHGQGASATIGIWNSSNEFQQYSYNEAKLRNGLSLIVSESGFIEANGSGGGIGGRYYTYDPVFNQLTSMTDELGRQMLYEIDPNNGNVLAMTQVVGEVGGSDDLVTQFTYTSLGLVDLMRDPLGGVTDYDYDAIGRQIKVTYALGTVDEAFVQYEYDLAGNQTAIIDENGNRTEWQYDALNRLIKVIEADPDGEGILTSPITTYTYDADGNLLTTTDPEDNIITNEYDVLNRLVKTTDFLNQVTTFTYDSLGNLLSVVDPLGNETQNIYDERNRLIKTIDPEGEISQFSDDLDNNLISVIDSVNNQTTFAYDARNRLIHETDSLGNTTFYEYDAVDNLIAQTDRNERRIKYQYDEINRLINESWVGTEQVINYSYDKASNLISLVDQYSSLSFSYDQRDRLTSVDNLRTPNAPHLVLTYTYDNVGNMLSIQDTINGLVSGTNSYSYDGLNRLIQLTQSGNEVREKRVDFAYNAIGQYTSLNHYSDLGGNQLVNHTGYSYDSLNRLTNLSHSNSQSEVAFYEFVYDASSRITRITDRDGGTDYTYDDRNQLTGANHSNVNKSDESYSYDANGNRISSSVHGDDYQTGLGNRLTSDGVYNYEYDNEGNLIKQTEIATGNIQAFEWDYRNRLVAVIEQDSGENVVQRVEFTYDAFDRRISKTVDTNLQDNHEGIVTHFVYNGEDVYLEFVNDDGVAGVNQSVLSQRYLQGAGVDEVLAQEDGEGNVIWLLTDHLGTIRDLVDDEGALVNHLVYDSFGQVIIETDPNIDTRYLFTGREWDEEIGLYYYRARYYDAEIGRFIGEDPISFAGGDANLYRYVGNSPLNATDPTGMIDENLLEALRKELDWCYQKFGTDKNRFKPDPAPPKNSCDVREEGLYQDPYHKTSLTKNPEQWLQNFDRRRDLFENVYKDNDISHKNHLKQKCREIEKRIRTLEQDRNRERKPPRNEFKLPDINFPPIPNLFPRQRPSII